jgi:hypothetical protein
MDKGRRAFKVGDEFVAPGARQSPLANEDENGR